MTKPYYGEPVFAVTEDADGGYVAYFFDAPKPQAIRLHLVRDEVFQLP